MMRTALLHSACWMIGAMVLGTYAGAQTPGSCTPAEAEAYLDVNDVRARIFNDGALFWKSDPPAYQVPKADSVSALFSSSVIIGGMVNDELRVAGTRYYSWQFWPGPLDDDGNPPADCTPYDRIYEINQDDIDTFNTDGTLSDNLRAWPWQLGAPVLDGDGDPDNYNLDGGDRPALLGAQMLWWVMNDAGNVHESPGSDTPPIGMEVHGSAFAFHRSRLPLERVTFYRYRLHYKGPQPFEDAYFGLYVDVDLGNFDDDYVGSDPALHLGYGYNADDFDEGSRGYGATPPAVGLTFLRSAVADADGQDNDRDHVIDEPGEMRGLDVFSCVGKIDWRYEEPNDGERYYNCLQGLWANGEDLTVGGYGIDFSDVPTRLALPGDPLTKSFWSLENIDGLGTPGVPHEMRFMMSTGPFVMQPGETQEIVFAVVWARGTDRLDSVRRLKRFTAGLHQAADLILQPDTASLHPAALPGPDPVLGFAQNYPNPFSGSTTIRYSLPQPRNVRLAVYDLLGRQRALLVDERQQAGVHRVVFEAGGVPPGVYVARFDIGFYRFTRKMLVVR